MAHSTDRRSHTAETISCSASARGGANTADRRGSVLARRSKSAALVALLNYRLARLKLDQQAVRHQAQARLVTASVIALSWRSLLSWGFPHPGVCRKTPPFIAGS